MGRRRVGKERTTDRDREQLGENENKEREREREGWMDGGKKGEMRQKENCHRSHPQCQQVFHIQYPTLNSDVQ